MNTRERIDQARMKDWDDNIPDNVGETEHVFKHSFFRDNDDELFCLVKYIRDTPHDAWRYHQIEFAYNITQCEQATLTYDELDYLAGSPYNNVL